MVGGSWPVGIEGVVVTVTVVDSAYLYESQKFSFAEFCAPQLPQKIGEEVIHTNFSIMIGKRHVT